MEILKDFKKLLLVLFSIVFGFIITDIFTDISTELVLIIAFIILLLYFLISHFTKKQKNNDKHSSIQTKTNIEIGNMTGGQIIVIESPNIISNKTIDQLKDKPLENKRLLVKSHKTSSIILDKSKEDDNSIEKRLKESKAFIDQIQFENARKLLFELLGEVKSDENNKSYLPRIYNNIGVTYLLPSFEDDLDESIKYFNLALEVDPIFYKAKINIGTALLSKDTEENDKKGYLTIKSVWETLEEKDIELIKSMIWATSRYLGATEGLKFIESLTEKFLEKVVNNETVLHLRAIMECELKKFDEALEHINNALNTSPESPELISFKAKTILLKEIESANITHENKHIPNIENQDIIEKAKSLFESAENLALNQNKDYLIPEIKYGITQTLFLLKRFEEIDHKLKEIKVEALPDELQIHFEILDFKNHLENREFTNALEKLQNNKIYSNILYEEKIIISERFILYGAPEQALVILKELEIEAIKQNDALYWNSIATVHILLNNKDEAIIATKRAKKMITESSIDLETKKTIFFNSNAIIYRYSKIDGSDYQGRFIDELNDISKEFPEENIVKPIKAINGKGELSEEIKNIIIENEKRYTHVRDSFKNQRVFTYMLEKNMPGTYASIISNRTDPEFTIEFTLPADSFVEDLRNKLLNSDSIFFDYLSLLDISKLNLFNAIERLDKKIYIHTKLFDKIQNDLLQDEIPELRELWNYLRKSKKVKFINDKLNHVFKFGNINKFLDEWLIDSIKYSKLNNCLFVTDDFRLLQFLKQEDIEAINIMTIINKELSDNNIDKKMYSNKLGSLAERFYTFLSFTEDDLLQIVVEDDCKIKPRSYHLINQIFLQGSDIKSFFDVFYKYIHKIWKFSFLPEDKINWLGFITRIVLRVLEVKIKLISKEEITLFGNFLGGLWTSVIKYSNREELNKLMNLLEKIFTHSDYETLKKEFKKKIDDKLDTL